MRRRKERTLLRASIGEEKKDGKCKEKMGKGGRTDFDAD